MNKMWFLGLLLTVVPSYSQSVDSTQAELRLNPEIEVADTSAVSTDVSLYPFLSFSDNKIELMVTTGTVLPISLRQQAGATAFSRLSISGIRTFRLIMEEIFCARALPKPHVRPDVASLFHTGLHLQISQTITRYNRRHP